MSANGIWLLSGQRSPNPPLPARKPKRIPRGQRKLRVTRLLRPVPDLQKIAGALIEMAMEMERKDEAERTEGKSRSSYRVSSGHALVIASLMR
jgi:hypothetical protein